MSKDQFDKLVQDIDIALERGLHNTVKYIIAKALAEGKVTEDWASCLSNEGRKNHKQAIMKYYLGTEV